MRLIDADEILYSSGMFTNAMDFARRCDIDKMPTVDAVPVVHGEWIEHGEPNEHAKYELWYYSCSVCHHVGGGTDRYCAYCGAKMDGGKGDETD